MTVVHFNNQTELRKRTIGNLEQRRGTSWVSVPLIGISFEFGSPEVQLGVHHDRRSPGGAAVNSRVIPTIVFPPQYIPAKVFPLHQCTDSTHHPPHYLTRRPDQPLFSASTYL